MSIGDFPSTMQTHHCGKKGSLKNEHITNCQSAITAKYTYKILIYFIQSNFVFVIMSIFDKRLFFKEVVIRIVEKTTYEQQ